MRKTSKIILVTIIATCILLGLGYAAIQNITLNIVGTASATADAGNFKVRFTDNISVSDSAYVTATRSGDQAATIDVSGLTSAGQKVTATYEIVNESSDLSADLKVDTSNSNIDYFKISSKLGSSSLTKGDSTTVLVTVELTKTPIKEDVNATIGVNLTAMPVQPGEEGTSIGTNDFSQTPEGNENVLNEYGFYFDMPYVFVGYGGIEQVAILHENGAMEGYLGGALNLYAPASSLTYSDKALSAEGMTIEFSEDGTQFEYNNATFTCDETYMDRYNSISMNEYGFYFGQAYGIYASDDEYVCFIFNMDGSAEIYVDGLKDSEVPKETIIYTKNKIVIGSAEFTVLENGRILEIDGDYFGLDLTFWEKKYSLELAKLNEYGFYYDASYSLELNENLKAVYIFNSDMSVEGYLAGILAEYKTSDSVTYEINKINVSESVFDITENGKQAVLGSSVFELDSDFMSRYYYYAGKKNEHGFYFNEPYSFIDFSDNTEPITTYVVHEDGSMKYYHNHELARSFPAGTLIYSENTIDATSIGMGIYTVKSDGRILQADWGEVVGLDKDFFERAASMNTEE